MQTRCGDLVRVVTAARLTLCTWRGALILISIYGDTRSDGSEPVEDIELVEDILRDLSRGYMTRWRWDYLSTHSAVVSPKDFYACHMCD